MRCRMVQKEINTLPTVVWLIVLQVQCTSIMIMITNMFGSTTFPWSNEVFFVFQAI